MKIKLDTEYYKVSIENQDGVSIESMDELAIMMAYAAKAVGFKESTVNEFINEDR